MGEDLFFVLGVTAPLVLTQVWIVMDKALFNGAFSAIFRIGCNTRSFNISIPQLSARPASLGAGLGLALTLGLTGSTPSMIVLRSHHVASYRAHF